MPRISRSGLRVLAIGLLILVPVLYVASLGPVGASPTPKTSPRGQQERFQTYYAPICYSVRAYPALAHPLNRYMEACDQDGLRFLFDSETGEVRLIALQPF